MPLDIDRHADTASAIQRWDPRLKIAALGVFVFGVALVQSIPLSIVAFILAAIFLRMSSLPFHFVSHGLQFVMIFLIPFFLIMPFTYPGEAAFHVLGIGFAWEGLRLACLIFIKAIAIVMTSFVIFGTSRFDVSMIALRDLKCPNVIVQMLLFTYRYTYVFMEEMKRMQVSMRARGFIPKTNGATLSILGNFVGTLLIRSFERTDRVYKAMLSKGYTGDFHTLVEFKVRTSDYVKAAMVLGVVVVLLGMDKIGWVNPAIKAWY